MNEAVCLESGTVHLWRISPSPSDAENLPAAEKRRYDGMTNLAARDDYAASQMGLRKVLARYLGGDWASVQFERQERGKPFVAGGPEFNLSHTAGGIFLAVSLEAIGLDVEGRTRSVSATALAEKFFTPEEVARIVGPDSEKTRLSFLRHWVAKEAMVKLSGDGIFHGLRDAVVRDEGRGAYRQKPVCLQALELPSGHFAALAAWKPFCVKFFFPT